MVLGIFIWGHGPDWIPCISLEKHSFVCFPWSPPQAACSFQLACRDNLSIRLYTLRITKYRVVLLLGGALMSDHSGVPQGEGVLELKHNILATSKTLCTLQQ